MILENRVVLINTAQTIETCFSPSCQRIRVYISNILQDSFVSVTSACDTNGEMVLVSPFCGLLTPPEVLIRFLMRSDLRNHRYQFTSITCSEPLLPIFFIEEDFCRAWKMVTAHDHRNKNLLFGFITSSAESLRKITPSELVYRRSPNLKSLGRLTNDAALIR